MYTYLRSIVLERSLGAQWKEAILGAMSSYNIYNLYTSSIHIVKHTLYENELYIDFKQLQDEIGTSNLTLTEWLDSVPNRTLPTIDKLPTNKIKYARYEDAIRVGYKANICDRLYNYDKNIPMDELPDLEITRPLTNTDVTLLHNKSIITINGYAHNTDVNTNLKKLFVIDGAKSLHKSKLNQFGIISFSKISDLIKLPINKERIFPENDTTPLYEKLTIDTGMNLTNKSFIMSIGGYLQFPEVNTCWQSGETSISLCLNKLPFLERYYESSQYLDLSSLELEVNTTNNSLVNIEQFLSNDNIKNYLTLSQSHIMILDTSNIFHRRVYIRQTNLPGMYISYEEPTYPQITGYGKVSEYWKTLEDGQWSINIVDGLTRRYVSSFRNMKELNVINDHRLPGRIYNHTLGYLLEIGSY